MSEYLEQLTKAMHASLELNAQTQATAGRSERFTKRMSVASLWVSIGSLAAALASIVIAVVALLSNH
jgi:hypothetical protein